MKLLKILFLLLVIPVLLFIFALALIWLPLPDPFPPAMSEERNQMVAIITGVFGFLFLIGLGFYTVSLFLKAGRFLDNAAEKAGLRAKNYLFFGRQYQGKLTGHTVKIDFMPPQVLRPSVLNIYLETHMGTRIAIGKGKPLLDCQNCTPITGVCPALNNLKIYAHEEEKARRLLADPTIKEVLTHLLSNQKKFGFREIYFRSEKIWLRAHPRQLTEALFQEWLEDMLKLAAISKKRLNG